MDANANVIDPRRIALSLNDDIYMRYVNDQNY